MNSTLSRRGFLGAGALAAVPSIGAAVLIRDPLLDVIERYNAGMAAYNASTDESDAFSQATWGAPYDELMAWKKPATTHESAVAALRLVASEPESFAHTLGPVALAFFERG